ncbi:MAG: cbb3-type cytochrome c oxidase N-terminal domain-containing protein [Pseudobdellovibrionaceae bacterium]
MSDSENKQNRDPLLTDHEYDGIQELDNSLPDWWLAIFLATIAFSFLYILHYESGAGLTNAQELQVAMDHLKSLKKEGPFFSEDQLNAKFTADFSERGHAVFESKCASCHGGRGEGLIGPNLTDLHWLHGQGTKSDILKIISSGAPEKGMPAWSEMISEDELLSVSSYVSSIKGTHVSGGKPPQGQEYQ